MTTDDDARQNPDEKQTDTNSASKDRVAGDLQQAKGRVKEGAGAIAGDDNLKVGGEAEQMQGAARSKKG